jgi:hypothetical protein
MSSQTSTRYDERLLTVGSVTIAWFIAAVFVAYNFHPTVGALFLILGWIALHATVYFLLAAVMAFDLTPGEESLEVAAGRRVELEREKKLLLKAIKEVEFDRDMGKVDPADASAVVARYRARALEIMRLIDADGLKQYEEKVEAEIVRRVGAPPAPPAPPAPEDKAAAPTCSSCGLGNDADAAFCKKCGTKL